MFEYNNCYKARGCFFVMVMNIAGLQKVSTIDYPGEIRRDTLRYRSPNKTIVFGHVFAWTIRGIRGGLL